jgi:hypothetical protein
MPSRKSAVSNDPESTDEKSAAGDSNYEIVSVEKAQGPDGGRGDDWYRYVINSPGSPITGFRRGTRKEVMQYVRDYAEKLRVRTSPRARSVWAPRRGNAGKAAAR